MIPTPSYPDCLHHLEHQRGRRVLHVQLLRARLLARDHLLADVLHLLRELLREVRREPFRHEAEPRCQQRVIDRQNHCQLRDHVVVVAEVVLRHEWLYHYGELVRLVSPDQLVVLHVDRLQSEQLLLLHLVAWLVLLVRFRVDHLSQHVL